MQALPDADGSKSVATDVRKARCYRCRGATVTEVLEPLSAGGSALTLTVHGLPVQVCARGHRQFVQSKIAFQQLLQVAEIAGADLPASEVRADLLGRRACPSCGTKVDKNLNPRTFHVPMQTGDVPFGIDLTFPVYQCRGCGKEHLKSRRELRTRAPAALLEAFRAAGIGQT